MINTVTCVVIHQLDMNACSVSRDVQFSEEELYYPQEVKQKSFEEESGTEVPDQIDLESTVTYEKGSRRESEEMSRDESREVNRDEIRLTEEESRTEIQNAAEEEPVAFVPRRSSRVIKAPVRLIEEGGGELHNIIGYCGMAVGEEPPSMRAALESEDRVFWEKALVDEHQAITKNNTYKLVERPRGQRVLRSKYVLKVKRRQDGKIDKYKARLVILGNMQEGGVDYEETFAPVMKYQSLRTVLAIANEEGLEVHQMDVKNAFLYGELEEDVYMEQPEFLVRKGEEEKVWKLNKALYGLKQAPRAWNKRLSDFLKGKGFIQCMNDTAIYIKGKGFEVKEELCQEFEMVDKREVREVQQDGGTLGVYKEED